MADFTLPPGMTQFCDANGAPLAAGRVYHYIVGTTTPKTTYSDINGTTPNTNPVILDSAGRAVIFGDGAYRQIVQDSAGNQIWDKDTQVVTLSTLGALAKAGDTATGRMTWTVTTTASTGATAATITPIGNPSLLSFNPMSGAAASSVSNEILQSVNFTSAYGAGASSATSKNKIGLYVGAEAAVGSGNMWGINAVGVIDSGAMANGGFQVVEWDLANNSGTHFGDSGGAPAQPAVFGQVITGISGNRATAALWIAGNLQDLVSPMWNYGIVASNTSVRLATFIDFTNSATSIDIRGTHSSYGIDFNSGTFTGGAIRLGNLQTVVGRNAANGADLTMMQVTAGNNIQLGNATSSYVIAQAASGFAPNADNTLTCGQAAARWSAVWAANGTIQTSDPTMKTDIVSVEKMPVLDILATINPITFRWIDGGGGQPGKRRHWGWDAEEVGKAFEAIGQDFGGYVVAEDGTRHLRPDQLIPVLWQAVKELSAKVKELSA